MGILKNIEWKDDSRNTIVYKVDFMNDYITKGSVLTVRESQAAVFCHKGKMADVFLPGYYKLNTDNIPLLTKLMGWKYGFESPFKSDIYYVNTKQFPNQTWGTKNPILLRDADYGAVRVRAFGTYSFKVDDPFVFMTELSGTNSSFRTQDITDWLRSIVITRITDIVGESKIPILDMAGNLVELGGMVEKQLNATFKEMGLALSKFNFENFSMPEALEKALDESTSLGILGKNMNTYMLKAQADALKDAAKNPGMAGSTMGAGIGMGMGMSMGHAFGNMGQSMNQSMKAAATSSPCPKCGAQIPAGSKFCNECGSATAPAASSAPSAVCPKCGAPVNSGSKFCNECGASMVPAIPKCKKCGATLKPEAKFCAECGAKT